MNIPFSGILTFSSCIWTGGDARHSPDRRGRGCTVSPHPMRLKRREGDVPSLFLEGLQGGWCDRLFQEGHTGAGVTAWLFLG